MQLNHTDNTSSTIYEPWLDPTHTLIEPGKQTVILIKVKMTSLLEKLTYAILRMLLLEMTICQMYFTIQIYHMIQTQLNLQ